MQTIIKMPPTTPSDEKYTPEIYFPHIQQALNGIGLDPTSDPSNRVPALHHITQEQDCFLTDWAQFLVELPSAYMNPPYSRTTPFVQRWCYYLSNGALDRGVTLTLSGVLQNKQVRPLLQLHRPSIVFPYGRINFVNGGDANDRDVVWLLWGNARTGAENFAQSVGGMLAEIRY